MKWSRRGAPLTLAVLLVYGLAVTPTLFAQQPSLQAVPKTNATDGPNSTVRDARRLMDAGRFSEAEGLLRAQLRTDPGDPDANEALAYCLLRENKPADALKQYTAAAALRTPHAAELVGVGQAYVLLNDMDDADRWTLRAVRMDPENVDAWYSLGRIRYTEQRFADALGCFRRALALDPKSAKIENNIGLSQEGLNHSEEAIAAYRRAIALEGDQARSPGSEQAYLNLGIALLHRGQMAEAQQSLEHAATISPHDPRILEQLGHLHLQQGDAVAAAASFSEAVKLDAGNSSLHFMLGQSYRRLGQTDRAQAEFAEAARLSRTPGMAAHE